MPRVTGGTPDDSTPTNSNPSDPVIIGGLAKNTDNTDPGSVSAEGDVCYTAHDLNRRQLVNTRHPRGFNAGDSQSSAQTNKSLIAAPGAGLSYYITDITFSNGATAGSIKLVEDTAGTPVDVFKTMYFDANSGLAKEVLTPIRITANKDVGYTSTTVTTHSVQIQGYIAP